MASWQGLRGRVALLFAAVAAGGVAVVGAGLWLGANRGGDPAEGYVIAGVVAVFGLAAVAAGAWYLFDERIAKPFLTLAADLQTRAVSPVSSAIDSEAADQLPELGEAAQAIHIALNEARASLDRALAEKTALMARDKALLEALLRELADGVVVISAEGRILLYNRVATVLLGPLGLDRPLERYLRTDPVRAAIERLAPKQSSMGSVLFLTSPVKGRQIFTGTVSSVELGEDRTGHVLHFRDMTEDLRIHGDLERLLRRTIEGARRPASAMGAVLDVLEAVPDMEAADRARFDASLRDELRQLTTTLEDSAAMEQSLNAAHWPIREIGVRQIFDAALVRAPKALTVKPSDLVVRCDGYAITETLAHVALAVSERPGHEHLTLSAEEAGGEVRLALAWRGPTLLLGDLESWLSQPVATAYADYTCRDALNAHRSDAWVEPVEGGARIVLPLTAAVATAQRRVSGPEQLYDFGLTATADPELGPRRLAELAFTVFDTETTGLDPDRDEVVQISGLRIVGGRLLRDEVFDRLVNPGRPIPPSSTEIHGVTDAMVADAAAFAEVADQFLAFAEGSVLVAHHAAFDMSFLQKHVRGKGTTLATPVLCTALLSSRLFSHSGDHSLDGLAARCGVEIESALRHTALGDSVATAEVFLKLIPLLEARGIKTLNDALSCQSGG